MIRIPYVNLPEQWKAEKAELMPLLEAVFSSGQYIGGSEVSRFEENVARYCGTKYAVALNSGTDALILSLWALGVGPGDEVITPPNSFIASTAAVTYLKARPVFVDVKEDQNIDPEKIAKAITKKTKAIMPVHLTGRVAAMDEILTISDKAGIPVVEDAAQSFGSLYNEKSSGSHGKVGCFSAHPLKNLNACGDAGFITTNDEEIFKRLAMVRNHGLVDRNTVQEFGIVSRLDSLQAAILNFRLERLQPLIKKRRENADLYRKLLNPEHIFIPPDRKNEFNTYHTFVIQVQNRDALQKYLLSQGIETSIHYPIPIHLQPASKALGYKKGDFPATERQAEMILTLPVHQYLAKEDVHGIADCINRFFTTS